MLSDKEYESSKRCVKCEGSVRYKSNDQCVSCKKERERLRYSNNRERIKEANSRWASKNKDKTRAYKEKYRVNNPDKIASARRIYVEKNKEHVSAVKKAWRERNPEYYAEYAKRNAERIAEVGRVWRKENSEKIIAKVRRWRKENIDHARRMEARRMREWRKTEEGMLVSFMRGSVRRCFHQKGAGQRTFEVLGYTHDELRSHLERQFTKKMNWANYGSYWVIDHIYPIAQFMRDGVNDPKKINCLSNLRPLCRKKNNKKRDKLEFIV